MNQRLAYLDNLKILLVVGVVGVHTAITYGLDGSWYLESYDDAHWRSAWCPPPTAPSSFIRRARRAGTRRAAHSSASRAEVHAVFGAGVVGSFGLAALASRTGPIAAIIRSAPADG